MAFSLGSQGTTHYFFGFILLLQLFFCAIEARRLVYYRLVRHRCRLMERGMYAHILSPGLPSADWQRPLRDSYMEDAVLIPFRRAFMIRVKRIYGFLSVATYVGWIFKILTATAGTPFPWIAFGIVTALVLPLAVYAILLYGEHRLDV